MDLTKIRNLNLLSTPRYSAFMFQSTNVQHLNLTPQNAEKKHETLLPQQNFPHYSTISTHACLGPYDTFGTVGHGLNTHESSLTRLCAESKQTTVRSERCILLYSSGTVLATMQSSEIHSGMPCHQFRSGRSLCDGLACGRGWC